MELQKLFPPILLTHKVSGVYRVNFSSGHFYIGGSTDLKRRFESWRTIFGNAGGYPSIKFIEPMEMSEWATMEILELCPADDVVDRESFYLNKLDCEMMVSYEKNAWRPVLQHTVDGVFVKRHDSISSAAKYAGCEVSKIQRVLYGERVSYAGMLFVYEKDYHKPKRINNKSRSLFKRVKKNGRDLVMYNTDGVEVKRFKKIKDAAKEVGCTEVNVVRVVSGAQKTAKGFIFKYA